MHFSIPDTQQFICNNTGANFTVSIETNFFIGININLYAVFYFDVIVGVVCFEAERAAF